MKIEIDIGNNLKQRIDSITEKPIKQFCQEAVEQEVEIIEGDLRLSCC